MLAPCELTHGPHGGAAAGQAGPSRLGSAQGSQAHAVNGLTTRHSSCSSSRFQSRGAPVLSSSPPPPPPVGEVKYSPPHHESAVRPQPVSALAKARRCCVPAPRGGTALGGKGGRRRGFGEPSGGGGSWCHAVGPGIIDKGAGVLFSLDSPGLSRRLDWIRFVLSGHGGGGSGEPAWLVSLNIRRGRFEIGFLFLRLVPCRFSWFMP